MIPLLIILLLMSPLSGHAEEETSQPDLEARIEGVISQVNERFKAVGEALEQIIELDRDHERFKETVIKVTTEQAKGLDRLNARIKKLEASCGTGK